MLQALRFVGGEDCQSVRFGKTFQPIETTAVPTPQMPYVLRQLILGSCSAAPIPLRDSTRPLARLSLL